MFELRDYQKRAIVALWRWWREDKGAAPLLVAPTGSGKTIVISEVIRLVRKANPAARIMVLTHVKELLVQNSEALVKQAPHLTFDTGLVSAGLSARDTGKPIVFAGVQTACRCEFPDPFTLVIIDECHLIGRKSQSQYGQVLDQLKSVNPDLRLLGLTATPYRLDSGLLHEGPDALFDGIAFDIPMTDLIEQGHLVPPTTVHAGEMKDLTVRTGEFTGMSQMKALDKQMDDIVEQIVARTGHLKTLLFLPTRRASRLLAKRLSDAELNADFIDGSFSAKKRESVLTDFNDGTTTHLCNVNLLTTGSNIPDIACVVLVRATMSPGLYVQMVGRGLRTHPDLEECLVLDFGGNAVRHGSLNEPTPPKPRKDGEPRAAPSKVCLNPNCSRVVAAGCGQCPHCGFFFPREENPALASNSPFAGEIVGWNVPQHWMKVWTVTAMRWVSKRKEGSITVRVSLTGTHADTGDPEQCDFWVCPEHEGFARKKFVKFWLAASDAPVPATVTDTLEAMQDGNCWKFDRVLIGKRKASSFMEIFNHLFDKGERQQVFIEGPVEPDPEPEEEPYTEEYGDEDEDYGDYF